MMKINFFYTNRLGIDLFYYFFFLQKQKNKKTFFSFFESKFGK